MKKDSNIKCTLQSNWLEVIVDEKMIYGYYTEYMLYFFPKKKEFSFPLRQISSIRLNNESDYSIKKIIFLTILIIISLILVFNVWGFFILFTGLFSYSLYKNLLSQYELKITTSWWDKEDIPLSKKSIKEAKELKVIAEEIISKFYKLLLIFTRMFFMLRMCLRRPFTSIRITWCGSACTFKLENVGWKMKQERGRGFLSMQTMLRQCVCTRFRMRWKFLIKKIIRSPTHLFGRIHKQILSCIHQRGILNIVTT